MGSPKTLVKYGLLAKVESTYGTYATMAGATDGVDLILPPNCEVDYVHQGERGGKSPASPGGRQMVGRMGRFGRLSVALEAAGGGSAYSASVKPNVHTMLRGCGMAATLDTSVGVEKVTYAPVAAGSEESLSLEAYYRGQKYPIAGAYGDWKLTSDTPGIPKFEFAMQGLFDALPTDVAVPTITYPTTLPFKAEGINLQVTVGGTTFTVGKIDSFELECVNNVSARALDNVTGKHGGFNMGIERQFFFNAVIESEALTPGSPYVAAAGFNIFRLMENAAINDITFTIGATQYNRLTVNLNNAQLVAAPEQDKDAASMWACRWKCQPSTLTANDEVELVFN